MKSLAEYMRAMRAVWLEARAPYSRRESRQPTRSLSDWRRTIAKRRRRDQMAKESRRINRRRK